MLDIEFFELKKAKVIRYQRVLKTLFPKHDIRGRGQIQGRYSHVKLHLKLIYQGGTVMLPLLI